jgi:hypothetical protein
LGLLLAGIVGPWVFELIMVPAEYTCSPPNYRLDGDFCGSAMSGVFVVYMVGAEWIRSIGLLFTGAVDKADTIRTFTIGWIGILLVLPVFSTLIIRLRPNHRWTAAFQITACVLAAGLGLFIGINSHPRLFYVVWGVWLYIFAAAAAAILEIIILLRRKRTDQVG